MDIIKETIEQGEIDCNDREHTPDKFVIEKGFKYFKGKWVGRKVRVVLTYDRARKLYKVITAYLE
ncbi:hypothetical protein NF865_01770 [Thermococcus aggregans]|uniref:DUF4258 domain-containing protein n=1 Tax=Thermococcus aggregans TaxID=110163 RepID=A0A9E7SNZ9_THEAG|nr:hypothetical protein [Thermococcus aggregans]USS40973.1 hypothetical protein NF865_01770 [Thermococcus aggregans]